MRVVLLCLCLNQGRSVKKGNYHFTRILLTASGRTNIMGKFCTLSRLPSSP